MMMVNINPTIVIFYSYYFLISDFFLIWGINMNKYEVKPPYNTTHLLPLMNSSFTKQCFISQNKIFLNIHVN